MSHLKYCKHLTQHFSVLCQLLCQMLGRRQLCNTLPTLQLSLRGLSLNKVPEITSDVVLYSSPSLSVCVQLNAKVANPVQLHAGILTPKVPREPKQK